MSLIQLKRQIDKANQLINEKVGGAKGTEFDDDYLETERKIDSSQNLFGEIMNKITEYLQPNPSYRAKMMTVNALNKMSGKASQKALYPQTENQISDIFLKYGKELSPTIFGSCLNETGDAFKELADIKYLLEDQVKQNFVEPISKLQEGDLKEIAHHRKKVKSKRLDYDHKKRNKDKGSKIIEDELKVAEDKFEESKNISSEAMQNFLDNEGEHVHALSELIRAEMEYHSRTAEILDSLYKSILEKKEECGSAPERHLSYPKKMSTFSDTQSITNEETNDEPIVTLSIKKKKDSASSHRVATCRAVYDFKAENEMELEFQEGDIIRLLQQVDDSWFEGEMKGRKGFFPINYVEVLIPLDE